MTVYSFYIFDRHTECIYQRRWVAPPPASSSAANSTPTASRPPSRPQSSSSHAAPAQNPAPPQQQAQSQHFPTSAPSSKASNDAKLLFGVVFSLRNLSRRLGGPADDFISYSTGQYKLHYYETATNLKFCMMTDMRTGNLRVVLHQIWANLWVEYVVRNPLCGVEHGTRGDGGGAVGNELFELGLDRFVTQVFNPS